MSKQRIYEYAKDLNIKSKDVIDELKKTGIEVSNHMQTLEDDQVKALDKVFKKNQAPKQQKEQKNTQSNHKNQKQG
ncbi:translation initiation factor IF-2 N-terminal domain-containing protein, partial [Staphylococcus pseudintermedius]